MKILVCGSRKYDQVDPLFKAVDACSERYNKMTLVYYDTKTIGTLVQYFACINNIPSTLISYDTCLKSRDEDEDEDKSKNVDENAGLLNDKDERIDLVLVFHPKLTSSKQTQEMVIRAFEQKISTWIVLEKKGKIKFQRANHSHIIG